VMYLEESGGGTRLEVQRGESERARHSRAKSVTYDHIRRPRAPVELAVYLDSGGGTRLEPKRGESEQARR
ncbi:MAG: hypothetical protein V3U14_12335, partial [candidate division NC10 bacterium]